MTIKVQCGCGTRYSFEVEPQGGAMPFRVNCPACNADGTEAANQVIAQSAPAQAQSRLRVQAATAAPMAAVVEVPVPTAPDLPPPPRPTGPRSVDKIRAEAKQMRRTGWIAAAVGVVILGLIGAYVWYVAFGTKPRLAESFRLDESQGHWRTEFLPGGRVLVASPGRALMHNVRTHADVWSVALPGNSDPARVPEVLVDKGNVWVCTGDEVIRLDEQTGQLKGSIPVTGLFDSFTPTESSILVVSAVSETRRVAMEIDLASGETSRRTIDVPRSEKHNMPDELPPNVQPTAGVLLAQALDEQKFGKPLDAVSSEFFSAGQNLVELRVTLIKPNVTWVKSIKPRGPSLINGNTTTATSATAVEEEVFNDIKRDQTGGVKSIDESTYEVRLRRWLGDQPVEWKGNVTGVPSFFSLSSVDLVVAGKGLTVFDKKNGKLFEAQLSYPINARFTGENPAHLAPAAERAGVLYFFDQGVLTAFSLPGGEVRWRLTSIGITRAQFDDAGQLYVDSTGASPEDIQYSDQIKFEATPPVIMKVDPRTGKILWQVEKTGHHCILSGKYVYTTSAEEGGVAMATGLAEALNAPRPEAPVYFHIYRLDPRTGMELWKFYREDAPDEEVFQDNQFVLRYGNDVQVWKYLDL